MEGMVSGKDGDKEIMPTWTQDIEDTLGMRVLESRGHATLRE